MRDQACLRELSECSGKTNSSAWLKAIPQPSLGLAGASHEFTIALCLWLGVDIFQCSCLSVIDRCGDHPLGYSHALHIHHHDALVSILYHVLKGDYPAVLREQRIC